MPVLFFFFLTYFDAVYLNTFHQNHWEQQVHFQCLSSFAQWCLTICDPMDCSPPGSSARGVFQARTLE